MDKEEVAYTQLDRDIANKIVVHISNSLLELASIMQDMTAELEQRLIREDSVHSNDEEDGNMSTHDGKELTKPVTDEESV